MKKSIFLLIVMALFMALSRGADAEDAAVAKVGDVLIKASALDEAVRVYLPAGGMHGGIDATKRLKYRKDALNDLIERELLYKEAGDKGLTASDADVQKVFNESVRKAGSQRKLLDSIEKAGLTPDAFREGIRKTLVVNALLESLEKGSTYSEEEIREHYEKNIRMFRRPEARHVYHMLLKVPPTATEDQWLQKKEYAEGLIRRIKAGEDFGGIAYNYSEDDWRVKYGDLGFVHKGQLEPEIEAAVFSLGVGEIGPPIRTIYGFHIVKSGDRKPEEQLSIESVRGSIKKRLSEKRFKDNKAALLVKLREKCPVAIYIAD